MAAREENITKAAALLHITQPTLSRQLMELEQELGVKLFERSSHRIVLTGEGLLLKQRAREIVSLEEKAREELCGKKELGGVLEFGSGDFKSFSVFADIMARFREENPNVHYKLYSGNSDNVKERIQSGLLDAGILSDPVDVSKYEFARLPEKEVWGVIAHEDLDIAKKDIVTAGDLKGLPLIIPRRESVRGAIEERFGNMFDEGNVFAVYDLLYNAAVMAQKKMGVILSIKLESRFDALKFIPLSPGLELGTVMVWKKNQVRSRAAEEFIRFAKKYVKSISDNTI